MNRTYLSLIFLATLVTFCGCESDTVTPETRPTPDLTAPTATILPLDVEQLSLQFELDFEAEDDTSGVAFVEIMARAPDQDWVSLGTFTESPVTFLATGPGLHSFSAVAVDSAGNRQETPEFSQAQTMVPEPIIITDKTGEDFDITNAVLRYSMTVDFWEHGFGRFAFTPVTDPEWWLPGHPAYPDTHSTDDIMALVYDDESHAYRIRDLTNIEVANDSFGDVHLAVTY